MKKSTKKILSITSACAFVVALGLGLFAFNNSGNSYKAGNNAKDDVKAAQVDEHAQQAEAQNNEAGKVAYVEGAKITSKTDLSTIPAPKEGESHIKKGETPEDNVFYVGPDAGDTYKDDANQANLAASNDGEGTQCVYWGIKNGTLTIRNTPNDDASNYNDQSGANADNPPAWHGFYKEIVAVDIQEAVKAPSYKSWFSPAEKSGWAHSPRIKYISGFQNLDLSGAVNTSYMFCGLNYDPDFAMTLIPSWGDGNTLNLNKVVNAAGMFACTGDASGKGTAFNCAFNPKTETVNIVSDGGLVQTQAMFQGAVMNPAIENLTMNLGNMEMSNVTNAGYMLHNSRNIKTVILGKVDGSKLVRARSMFNNMKQTTKIDMSQWSKDLPNTADANFDYVGVFQNDAALQEIHTVENLDWSSFQAVKEKSWYMFYGDASLVGSDGTQCDGTDTTVEKANADLALHITKLNDGNPTYETLGAGYFTVTTPKAYETTTENGTTLNFVYDSVYRPDASIYSVYQAERPTGEEGHQATDVPWNPHAANFNNVVFDYTFRNYQPKQVAWWFEDFSTLTLITGMENFDFSKVGSDINHTQGFRGTFNKCDALTTAKVTDGSDDIIDLSNYSIGGDNYHINYFRYTFSACTSIKEIILPNSINTSSVSDFAAMFSNMNKLTKVARQKDFNDVSEGTIDLSSFNTENATDLSNMLHVNTTSEEPSPVATRINGPGSKEYPTKLSDSSCNLSHFASGRNTNLKFIDFYYCDISNCSSLKNFATSCADLQEVWLSKGAPGAGYCKSHNTYCAFDSAFSGCSNLRTIYATVGDCVNTFESDASATWNVTPPSSTSDVNAGEPFTGCRMLTGSSGTCFGDWKSGDPSIPGYKYTNNSPVMARLDRRVSGDTGSDASDKYGYLTRVSQRCAGGSSYKTGNNFRYRDELMDKVVRSYDPTGNNDYDAGFYEMRRLFDGKVIESIIDASIGSLRITTGDYTSNKDASLGLTKGLSERWLCHVDNQRIGAISLERMHGDQRNTTSNQFITVPKASNDDWATYQDLSTIGVKSNLTDVPWSNQLFIPQKVGNNFRLLTYNDCGFDLYGGSLTATTVPIRLGTCSRNVAHQWKLDFNDTSAKAVISQISSNANDGYKIKFYYDNADHSSEGTVYWVPGTCYKPEDVPWLIDDHINEIKTIEAHNSFANWPGWVGSSNNTGAYWFHNFTGLEYVNLPNEFKVIGDKCFENCSNLKKLVIGTSDNGSQLTKLGTKCFEGCEHLENYVLRKSGTNDKVNYDASAFDGAGTNNPEVAAPLIKVGGTNTKALSGTTYNYVSVAGQESAQAFSVAKDNYYYLNGDVFLNATTSIDLAGGAAVIDLNGNNISASKMAASAADKRCFVVGNNSNTKLRLDDTSLNGGGQVRDGDGGQSYHGGAFQVVGNSSIDFVRGHICENKAAQGGGINVTHKSGVGAILRMYEGSYINDNTSTQQLEYGGGAIQADVLSNIFMYGGEISNNKSWKYGAGVYLNSVEKTANMFIYNGIFNNNKTSDDVNSDIYSGNTYYPRAKVCVKEETQFSSNNIQEGYINEARGYFRFTHDYSNGVNTNTITKFEGNNCTTCILPYNKDENITQLNIGNGVDPIFDHTGSTNSGCSCINITENTSEIKAHAFEDSKILKKITIDNKSLSIGESAFENCINLENLVVTATSADTISYGNRSFDGAGSAQEGISHAKFVVAGANAGNTFSKFGRESNYYIFTPKSSMFDISAESTKRYYYLTSNINQTENMACHAADSVLDLNNHSIDRNLTSSKNNGTVLSMKGTGDTGSSMVLRIDNTTDINTKANSLGQIRGGYSQSEKEVTDDNFWRANGGGISMVRVDGTSTKKGWTSFKGPKTLNFVNGNICDNRTTGEGAGIWVSNYNEGSSLRFLNMYGGVIANNHCYKSSSSFGGGGVCCNTGCCMNMYGGYIIGNLACDKETIAASTIGGGGAIAAYDTAPNKGGGVNIYGGRIGGTYAGSPECNDAKVHGGCIFIDKYAEIVGTGNAFAKYNKLDGQDNGGYYNSTTYPGSLTWNNQDGPPNEAVNVSSKAVVYKTTPSGVNDDTYKLVLYNDRYTHADDPGLDASFAVPESASGASDVPWQSYANKDKITEIEFEHSFDSWPKWTSATENTTRSWFEGFTGLKNITIPDFVTRIGVDCFKDCTNLKKVVVGNTNNPTLANIDDNAFQNCTCLENYVLRKSGAADTVTYTGNPFNGAGTDEPMKAAPLILAGGQNTSAIATTAGLKSYTYKEISNTGSGAALTFENGTYNYMIGNYNLSTHADVNAGVDAVLDLNSNVLDRELTSAVTDGQAIHVKKDGVLRIDDTSSAATGTITGGKTTGSLDIPTADTLIGGGAYVVGTLNMVNGTFANNEAAAGGAIGIANSTATSTSGGKCQVNIYNGKFSGNKATATIDSKSGVYGGGAIFCREYSTLNMYGGEVSNNTSSTHYGGAIYSSCMSTFVLLGGKIVDNKKETSVDGGIFVTNGTSTQSAMLYEYSRLDTGGHTRFFVNKDLATVDYPVETIYVKKHTNATAVYNNSMCGDKIEVSKNSSGEKVCKILGRRAAATDDYCLYFPSEIGTYKLNEVAANAYLGQSLLRKVVFEQPQVAVTVGNSAFANCERLENFVVRSSADSLMNYGTGVLAGSGVRTASSDNYKKAAPIIVAGSSKEQSLVSGESGITYYPYAEIAGGAFTSTINLNENKYYYLCNNYYASVDACNAPMIQVSANCVLDLANKTINKNRAQAADLQGGMVLRNGTSASHGNSFRLDNSWAFNGSCGFNSYGQITGGYESSSYGGGMLSYSKTELVGGNLYNNTSGSSAGIATASGSSVNLTMFPGAMISTNHAVGKGTSDAFGGGVGVGAGCNFTMYGGKIIRNEAKSESGTSGGGGVYVYCDVSRGASWKASTFTLYGGQVGSSGSDPSLQGYLMNDVCGGGTNWGGGLLVRSNATTEEDYVKIYGYGGAILLNKLNGVERAGGAACYYSSNYGAKLVVSGVTWNNPEKSRFPSPASLLSFVPTKNNF